MHDIQDLRTTIVPRSDQLNSESLLGGPIAVTVTNVKVTQDEQPIIIGFDGDDGRPYKPCKTMRKIIIFAWGGNGLNWVGRSMTLYNDPSVKFGTIDTGGIRISHMTHIERELKIPLTVTKGRKAVHIVKPMAAPAPAPTFDHVGAMTAAATEDALKKAFKTAYRAAKTADEQAAFKATYDARLLQLMNPGHQQPAPPPPPAGDAADDNSDFLRDMDAAGGQP